MKFLQFVCIILMLLFFEQCKKVDENNVNDINSPKISIGTPANSSHFNAFDTVLIKGIVHDYKKVERVVISLNKDVNIKVMPSVELIAAKQVYELNVAFPLNDKHLESGEYYFVIEAFNDQSSRKAFLNITYTEFPTEDLGLYAISVINDGIWILKLDSNNELTKEKSLPGDFMASAINHYDQQLYTIGSVDGNLNAYNLENNKLAWVKMASHNNGDRSFRAMFYNDRKVYYSNFAGQIRAVEYTAGLTIFATESSPGFVAERILNHDDKIVTVEKSNTSDEYILVVYQEVSGVEVHRKINVNKPAAMFYLDDEHVLLFTNKGNDQEILSYNLKENFFEFQRSNLSKDSILNVVKGAGNSFIFSTISGIYEFDANNFSSRTIATVERPESIAYNKVSGEIWYCTGNKLESMNPFNGSIINSVPNTVGTLKSVLVRYNK